MAASIPPMCGSRRRKGFLLEFFDMLLEKCGVVGTPGSGFGANGEGFFRLTSFNTKENTEKALAKIVAAFAG